MTKGEAPKVGNRRRYTENDPITWSRLRAIFGNPKPPRRVTQRQFDYSDDKLQELGKTPYNQIAPSDLWYYHHDLAYVELQPELFAYLFPVCLMDWHETLLLNEACAHGDSEFHYGVSQGNVMDTMLNRTQRGEVEAVLRDSLLYRIDQERSLRCGGMKASAHGWIFRLNSLGIISNELPPLWDAWWQADTPGRSMAVLQYATGFMFYEGENPVFSAWTRDLGGGGPYLYENDSMIYDRGWPTENVEFLAEFLSTDRLERAIKQAAATLRNHKESEIAELLVTKIDDRRDLIDSRVEELPELLRKPGPVGWSV